MIRAKIDEGGFMKPARIVVGLALLALLAGVTAGVARQTPTQPPAYVVVGTPTELGLAGYAKILWSAVFVSGRDADEGAKNSAYWMMPAGEQDKVQWTIDRAQKLVRASFGGITREAKFYSDQGCIIHPPGKNGIFFTPVTVKSALPDAATESWPMGDRPDTTPFSSGIDRAKIDAAVDAAFADPAALTAAFLVVYKGHLIAERYGPGITKDTQLESWSMGKSIISTLFSLLVKDGTYTIDQPAPVPLWRSPDDPRSKIRNMDLLHMSGGLKFVGNQEPGAPPDQGYPDHYYIYTGAVN